MKGQIMADINSQLSALGIMPIFSKGTDITITTELITTNGRYGSKEIVYEALIYLDQQQKTAFMYEKSSENKSSLPSETSGSLFQSGTATDRNENNVRYGLDGTIYEFELEMGTIAKAVRQSVKRNGWKFKTVLQKRLAQFPTSEEPESISQPINETQSIYAASANYTSQSSQPIYTPPAKFSTAYQTNYFAGPYPAFAALQSPRYFAYPRTLFNADTANSDAAEQGSPAVYRTGLILLGILTILTMTLFIVLETQASGFFFGTITLVMAGLFLKNRNRNVLSIAIMLLLTTVVLYAILISTTIF
jgi:hypothetical protein